MPSKYHVSPEERQRLIKETIKRAATNIDGPVAFYEDWPGESPHLHVADVSHQVERSFCALVWENADRKQRCLSDHESRSANCTEQQISLCWLGIHNAVCPINTESRYRVVLTGGGFRVRGQMNAAEQQLQQSLETIPLEQQRLFLEVWNQVPQVDEADLLGYKMRELKLAGRNYLHALKQFSDFRYLTDLATHDVMIALQSLMSAVDVLKRDMKDTFGIGRRWEERFDALIQLCRKENTSLEAKLNPDQLRYGYSSIGKLIHECVDTHIPQAKERLIDFKIDLEQLLGEEGKHKVLNIYMDRIALGQAINNVIDNAVKYSFSGTIDHHRWIDILGRSESIGGTPGYRVMVSNLGVGIEEDELKLVFKRGYQGRRRLGEDRSGSGIGLTFVKECIEQHGGTISIRSQPQRRTGWLTVVSVWLPIHGHADNYSQEV